MVGVTYMGLPVTRWGRLGELVEALLLTLLPPTLASRLQSVKLVSRYCSLGLLFLLSNLCFFFMEINSLEKKVWYFIQLNNNSPGGSCPDRSPQAHFSFWSEEQPLICSSSRWFLFCAAVNTVSSARCDFVYAGSVHPAGSQGRFVTTTNVSLNFSRHQTVNERVKDL